VFGTVCHFTSPLNKKLFFSETGLYFIKNFFIKNLVYILLKISLLTILGGILPFKAVNKFSTAITAILVLVSTVALPI
jgi:hypothetical protein